VGRTEEHVVGLLEQLLGPCERQRRFAWARGDVSARTGRAAMLPFDAVWEARRLIVEIDEDQHTRSTRFFDKPQRMTVSGVHRGQQRALYDERKRRAARAEGYLLVAIPWPRRRRPQLPDDLREVREILEAAGIL
jgi:hypothetical protein